MNSNKKFTTLIHRNFRFLLKWKVVNPSSWTFNLQSSLSSEGRVTLAVQGLPGLLHWVLLSVTAQDLHAGVQDLHRPGQKGAAPLPLWEGGVPGMLCFGCFFFLIHGKGGIMVGNKTPDENPSFCQGLFDVEAPGLVSLLVL